MVLASLKAGFAGPESVMHIVSEHANATRAEERGAHLLGVDGAGRVTPVCSRSGSEGVVDMRGRSDSYPWFGSDDHKVQGFTSDHNVYVRGAAVSTRPHSHESRLIRSRRKLR